ncbi:response regulator [candidate division KSB3 bacterium]|uniref:histidine kinase n=1 Tax=candidate division KSB3 bacterium TaxID=2044937 RepID=A0A9D5JX54_9BACT|nr:response regulator [candidate division KSB3 bacterium]MBD3325507.1 response regulator [candidate division KSB3 bacterium]
MKTEPTTVLCIDDEEMIRLSIADYLEDSGYQVHTAENGKAGLQMFREQSPAIVLVDLRMPEVDGLEVLATVRDESPEIPVIVVSGTGLIQDVVEALHLGAWDYITKPIEDMAILELAVEQCLEKSRIMRENREYKHQLERLVQERTEALQHSEKRLKLALEAANEGLWDFNPQTGDTYYSPRWFTLLGYAPDQFLHHNDTFLQLIHPEDRPIIEALSDYHQALGATHDVEFRMKSADGDYRWISSKGKTVELDEQGRTVRIVGTHTDITRRKNAEQELKRLNEELEQRVAERTAKLEETLETVIQTRKQLIQSEKLAALGGLVAGIAHEINTPLGVGVTAASHLELKTQEVLTQYTAGTITRTVLENYLKVAKESSTMILANLARADELIKSFKQISVDQSSEEKRSFLLKEYIHHVLVSLGPKLKETQYRVVVNCSEDLVITSYPGAFSQILTNWIMNSLIHGFHERETGEIKIDAWIEDHTFYLTYHDNGQGIQPEHLSKIFDPFFTTRTAQSGLGLFIVYNLVIQKLGGTLTCDSQPGEGTKFIIAMPDEPPDHEEKTNERQ